MRLLFAALSSGLFFTHSLAAFVVNTPADAIQCEPTLLTWTEGVAPYFVDILPGGSPGGTPLEDIGEVEGTSFTWDTNVAAGTSVTVEVRDSTGSLALSAPFTIEPSDDSSCLQ